jgi:hypothetical protein
VWTLLQLHLATQQMIKLGDDLVMRRCLH